MAVDRTGDGGTARLRVARGLLCDPLGLGGVVGVLLDIGRHLLHRRGSFLRGSRLLAGAGRQLLRAGRKFLAARRNVIGRGQRIGDHDPKLLDHGVQGIGQILDLVVAAYLELLREIAVRDGTGHCDGAGQATADADRNPEGRNHAEQYRGGDACQKDQPRMIVDVLGFDLRIFQGLVNIHKHPVDLLADRVEDLSSLAPGEVACPPLGHLGAESHDAVVGWRPFCETLEELIRERPVLRIRQAAEYIALVFDDRDRCLELLIPRCDVRIRGGQNRIALTDLDIAKQNEDFAERNGGTYGLRRRFCAGETVAKWPEHLHELVRMP